MRKIFFIIVMMIFCVAASYAQQNNTNEVPGVDKPFAPIPESAAPAVHTRVEVMPEFIGGLSALRLFLNTNIRYPAQARRKNIQGKVVVKFIVNENGAVVNPQIIRSVDDTLDEEALRVIKSMPNWKPGLIDGKPVKVYYTLPISFKLG